MKHLTKIGLLLLISIATLSFDGCKKDKGVKGDKGDTGATGNANIQSFSFTVYATDWIWTGSPQYKRYSVTTCSLITSTIMSSGALMLYNTYGSYLEPLPYSFPLSSTKTRSYTVEYALGEIYINVYNSDYSDPMPSTETYRLVAIPPAIKKANPNVNWKDYNEVQKLIKSLPN